MTIDQAKHTTMRIRELWPRTTVEQGSVICDALKSEAFASDTVNATLDDMYLADSKFFDLSELRRRLGVGPSIEPTHLEMQARRQQELQAEWAQHSAESWNEVKEYHDQLSPAEQEQRWQEYLATIQEPILGVVVKKRAAGKLPLGFLAWLSERAKTPLFT